MWFVPYWKPVRDRLVHPSVHARAGLGQCTHALPWLTAPRVSYVRVTHRVSLDHWIYCNSCHTPMPVKGHTVEHKRGIQFAPIQLACIQAYICTKNRIFVVSYTMDYHNQLSWHGRLSVYGPLSYAHRTMHACCESAKPIQKWYF